MCIGPPTWLGSENIFIISNNVGFISCTDLIKVDGKRPTDQWYSEIKDFSWKKMEGQSGTGNDFIIVFLDLCHKL